MKKVKEYKAGNGLLVVELRYDDECKNGHKSFAITGTLYRDASKPKTDRNIECCGCIHDEIVKYAPELEYLIKWHLCNEHEPMHYLANTLYLAGTKDCYGKEKGEPYNFKRSIKFNGSPFLYTPTKELWAYLDEVGINAPLWKNEPSIIPVYHSREPQTFSANYTLDGLAADWYSAPFKNEQEALCFTQAMRECTIEIVENPTAWGKGKEPDLEGARVVAIAPDATLEQLQDRQWLIDRLPALMAEFNEAMQRAGLLKPATV